MRLQLKNIGPITSADIRFGDLTVFVGPQASGKSIALQLLKLLLDRGHIQDEMSRYGVHWSGELPKFFDAYFGEGMHGHPVIPGVGPDFLRHQIPLAKVKQGGRYQATRR